MTVLASRDSEAVGMQTHVTQSTEEGSAVQVCRQRWGRWGVWERQAQACPHLEGCLRLGSIPRAEGGCDRARWAWGSGAGAGWGGR